MARKKDRAGFHRWTYAELEELFYEALLRDNRSEGYTVGAMRNISGDAANAGFSVARRCTQGVVKQSVLCADGSPVHDFKGQPVCPACGFRGIVVP